MRRYRRFSSRLHLVDILVCVLTEEQQLVNFDRSSAPALPDDSFYVLYFVITCGRQQARRIKGHMGAKQSSSAYQILSQCSDSSAVCPGCHGCFHSNLVGTDGLIVSLSLLTSLPRLTHVAQV